MHLAGFYESQDPAGAFVFVAALDDPLGLDDGDDFIVPDMNQIVAYAAGVPSGGGQRVRVDGAGIRDVGRWEITGFNGGADAAAEPDSPQIVHDFRSNPIVLKTNNRMVCEMDYNPTAAAAGWLLFWLSNGPVVPVATGVIRSVRVTTVITLVAGAWGNVSMTFADPLPVGKYQLVGARFQAAGLVAARFLFRDSGWRPGVLCVDDENDQQHSMFRNGGLGVLGEFHSTSAPSVDFLSISADANPAGVLDLIQIAAE